MNTINRRKFIDLSALATGATLLPSHVALGQSSSKFIRHNVTSAEGKKALASYAIGVKKMLELPPDHPHNWFRYAFIHLLDCPHGNWWFYVWHRGYLAHFEQIIRKLSGDSNFALPFWDWTTQPTVPNEMFNGVLDPHSANYAPFTGDLTQFTNFIKPELSKYWGTLRNPQLEQLKARGYSNFDSVWNDVTGFDPITQKVIPGNMCFATNSTSRYLTASNPDLDKTIKAAVANWVVYGGLMPDVFYDPIASLSFNSSKTTSHVTAPPDSTVFSILEGHPHNVLHNGVGGVGHLDPGPYGLMTNFLSSSDPIFYLHHANIDRLWDVWARKQKIRGLSAQPSAADMSSFASEPFLFFVDADGKYVSNGKAWDYFDMSSFGYTYEPSFGEEIVKPLSPSLAGYNEPETFTARIKNNEGYVALSANSVRRHINSTSKPALVAEVTIMRPHDAQFARLFHVIIGAPANVTDVNPGSPYFAGTIGFFGNMSGMKMPMNTTFVVPLPPAREEFSKVLLAMNENGGGGTLNVRVVSAQGSFKRPPMISSIKIRSAAN